jgi:hydroxylamine reductase (hybrid-cluster protein)
VCGRETRQQQVPLQRGGGAGVGVGGRRQRHHPALPLPRLTPLSTPPPSSPARHPQGKKDYGNVPGTSIPRVLDMGQCNDSYSAVVVATELAKAFGCGVNDLPLSIVLSWLVHS